MKTLIITVAGMSTRFSASVGHDVLKCIYYENEPSESLLYNMVCKHSCFDKFVIVGGYKFSDLVDFIEAEMAAYKDKIILVENTHYKDYGSGYSLYLGILKATEDPDSEITFAEGDLFVDEKSFAQVIASNKSVITCNTDLILASKAVVLYFDTNDKVHYVYDVQHGSLSIKEPFISIYNSGQIWKFTDRKVLDEAIREMTDSEWQSTNLILVEKYFQKLSVNDYVMIVFEKWINCNTVLDFRKSKE